MEERRAWWGEMNAIELKPGIIVRGPVLPEPVEVLVVTPLGDAIKIAGAGQKTGQVHQRVRQNNYGTPLPPLGALRRR